MLFCRNLSPILVNYAYFVHFIVYINQIVYIFCVSYEYIRKQCLTEDYRFVIINNKVHQIGLHSYRRKDISNEPIRDYRVRCQKRL